MKNYSFFRAIITILLSALLTATLLVTFSPGSEYIDQIVPTLDARASANNSSVQGGPKKIIGIIPGHYGFDTGFQCGAAYNFVKENDVNLRMAIMVRDYLTSRGYSVDFLHEFDPALSDYTGLALVSIHTNSCDSAPSGFNVTTGGQNTYPSESKRLNDCLTYYYGQNSELSFLGENYTPGEEYLYSFDTVNDYTTISIIHTGALSTDYRTISEKTESLAKGIGDGIICYVENETVGSVYNPQPASPVQAASTQKMYKISISPAMAEEN